MQINAIQMRLKTNVFSSTLKVWVACNGSMWLLKSPVPGLCHLPIPQLDWALPVPLISRDMPKPGSR